MDNQPRQSVSDAYSEAWRLKRPFLLSHMIFSLLRIAVIAPLLALTIRWAIALSGKPALSDFDIALFLLSPAGFIAAVLVISLILTTNVLDVSFMMAISQRARTSDKVRFDDGIARILPYLPRIAGFAMRLLLRVLIIAVPFVVLSLLIAQSQLTEFDINYYLTEKPPEFIRAAVMIGVLLGILALLLTWYSLGWAVALPQVLFEDVSPKESFASSVARMKGRRGPLLIRLLIWAAVSALTLFVLFWVVRLFAGVAVGLAGQSLGTLAFLLFVLVAIWSLLNLIVTTMNSGALAILLMECAGWPGSADAQLESTQHRIWLRRVFAVGAVVGAAILVMAAVDLARRDMPDDVIVIAHRGAAGSRPENTMAAFSQAIEDRADFVELDVQESAEGEIIVMHDSDYMKIAGVDLKAWDATAEGLTGIDIGSWYEAEYSDQRTPTLRDVLELAKGTESDILIELKYYGHDTALEQRVADVVEETGMQDNMWLMSLKYDGVQKMKALRPEWQVGLLAATSVGSLWDLESDFLAVNMEMATPGFVRSAREAGKEVYVWTVNDPLAMSRMVSFGAAGLITDEPALARRILDEREALNIWERMVLALGSQLGLSATDKVYRDASP